MMTDTIRIAEETLEQYERHEQAQANNQQQAGENQTNTAEQGEAQPTRPPKVNFPPITLPQNLTL